MWIINDEKAREFVTALFPDETEISDAYEYQKDNDDDSVELIAYEGVKARANMRIKKALFKEVREYDPNYWNPYPEVEPPKSGIYLVYVCMYGKKSISVDEYTIKNSEGNWRDHFNDDVLAFRPWNVEPPTPEELNE